MICFTDYSHGVIGNTAVFGTAIFGSSPDGSALLWYTFTMDQLLIQLKQLLSDNVALKFKSHGYHWNVEGDDFIQFHDFFGDIYKNFDDATDTYAEWLRALGQYVPYRLADFFDMSSVSEPVFVGDPQPMLADLYNAIEIHIENLVVAVESANQFKQYGLSNFFADRQTATQKICWKLRTSIETKENN